MYDSVVSSRKAKFPVLGGLLSWQACDAFDAPTVCALYEAHVGRTQVRVLGLLGLTDFTIARAAGNRLFTDDGREILDFTGGVGVLSLGHNHPRILAAREQFARLERPEQHKGPLSKYLAGLSYNIARLLPGDLNVSFLCNSGAEAVEGALKLAYKFHDGRRPHILHADNAFHGKSLATSGLMGHAENSFPFPMLPGAQSFAYGDIESVEQLVATLRLPGGESGICAILLEPYCVNHLIGCGEEFLRRLRALCTRERIVLIFDEVYTGWGKTGSLFYFMRHAGLLPDILTMSKTLGGGKASISCYTARESFYRRAYDNLKDFMLHSTTYNGFSEECITAIEAINIVVEEDLPARARQIGERLGSGLSRLQAKYPDLIEATRGCGAHHGLLLTSDFTPAVRSLLRFLPGQANPSQPNLRRLLATAMIAELLAAHQIMVYCVPNRTMPLILSPSLVTTDAEIDRALEALDATLARGKIRLIGRLAKNALHGFHRRSKQPTLA